MQRSGAIWLVKVTVATAVLATVGILPAPAGKSLVAPMEPAHRERHWSATA